MKSGDVAMNVARDTEECILDEDIKHEFQLKLNKLKDEYNFIKSKLMKEAFNIQKQRNESDATSCLNVRSNVTCDVSLSFLGDLDEWMLDEKLWKRNKEHKGGESIVEKHKIADVRNEDHAKNSSSNCNVSQKSILNCCIASSLKETRRSRRQSSSHLRSNFSPILCKKSNLKRKRQIRKFFPLMPKEMLKDMTNTDLIKEFNLPESILNVALFANATTTIASSFTVKTDCTVMSTDADSLQQSSCVVQSHISLMKNTANEVSRLPNANPYLMNSSPRECNLTFIPETPQLVGSNLLKKTDAHSHNVAQKAVEMSLMFQNDACYLAVLMGDICTVVYEKSDAWREIWRKSSDRKVDSLHWLLCPLPTLVMMKTHFAMSKIWISVYDVKNRKSDDDVAEVVIEEFLCVTELSGGQFVTGGKKVVKYKFNHLQRRVEECVTLMPATDERIMSLSAINNQPAALLGCTCTTFYIWNHVTGCLLQQIEISLPELRMKELLDATTGKGSILCHASVEDLLTALPHCASVIFNPINGRCLLNKKEKLFHSNYRLSIYSDKLGKLVLHQISRINHILKGFPFSSWRPSNLDRCCFLSRSNNLKF